MSEYALIAEIVKRSKWMEIGCFSNITRILDIEFAHKIFNLDLQAFAHASKEDFAHDFCGIQNHLDRTNKMWIDDGFIPRFTNKEIMKRV